MPIKYNGPRNDASAAGTNRKRRYPRNAQSRAAMFARDARYANAK